MVGFYWSFKPPGWILPKKIMLVSNDASLRFLSHPHRFCLTHEAQNNRAVPHVTLGRAIGSSEPPLNSETSIKGQVGSSFIADARVRLVNQRVITVPSNVDAES